MRREGASLASILREALDRHLVTRRSMSRPRWM
jgi:hypothetical protein